jgi:hypothetical protein
VAFLVSGAGLVVGVAFALTVPGRDRRGALTLAALAAGALGGALLAAADYFVYRNVIQAWIPLAVVVAAILVAPRLARLGTFLAATACVASAAITLTVVASPGLQREDWRAALDAVGPRADRVLVVLPWFTTDVTEFYRPTVPAEGRRTREVVVLGQDAEEPHFSAPRGFTLVETRRIEGLTLHRFRSSTPVAVTAELLGIAPDRENIRVDRDPKS